MYAMRRIYRAPPIRRLQSRAVTSTNTFLSPYSTASEATAAALADQPPTATAPSQTSTGAQPLSSPPDSDLPVNPSATKASSKGNVQAPAQQASNSPGRKSASITKKPVTYAAVPAKKSSGVPSKSPPATTPNQAEKPQSTPKAAAAAKSKAALGPASRANNPPQHTVYQPPELGHLEEQTAADVDWATSFHGVSAKPVTSEQFERLNRPLNTKDIEVKPDGIIYLPEIKYRRRLNEAFGPLGWGLVPRGEPVVGDNIVTREYALIIGGRFAAQAQGENNYFGQDQLPSAVEGCKSNALMRCCKDLGIGSELWDPQFIRWFRKTSMEEVWVEHLTTKKKRTFWYRKDEVDVAYPYKLVQR
ncbi:hypothetical protein S40285_04935 [Stachybotrys chlorohalonatus IBT 40285]|uniref:Mitochondrial genome maintenance protein MGM101 n=1 Tax=Stachybotrys chlorohalonatus (strain IBT 40285) TaxID=1283841 RepID=A0A084QUL0_STAC4|nr:hypothetical protein S40285_04935 [Stachybotrys chlorohalonata IBT 40285]